MGISWPFLGMVLAMLAQASDAVVSKAAMSRGLSKYVLLVYSNALSTLILLPISFYFHRSERPPLNFSIIFSIFLLALIGYSGLVFGYAGIQYSSATLSTAMLNLVPAFTFVLAVFFRMEKVDLRISSSQAKLAGTVVSIVGAFIVTFYKGVPVVNNPWVSGLTHQILSSQRRKWILGGFLSSAHAMVAALWYTYQASILRKYPAVLIVLSFYCLFVTFQSTVVCLIAEKDLRVWTFTTDISLVAVVYSAVIGTAFRYVMTMLCVRAAGPLYVSMFKPIGIVAAAIMSIIFLGDTFYLGSLVGAIVIAAGFYAFLWGKAREEKTRDGSEVKSLGSPNELKAPLLQSTAPEIKRHPV